MDEKNKLKSSLMDGMTAILMRDELEVETQLEVLTDAYADVVRFHATAILGQDGDEYLSRLCAERLHKVEIPLHGGKGAADLIPAAAMERVGNHRSADSVRRGGRIVQPDEANSWLRVFPSPLSAEQVLRNVLIRTADGSLGYNPADVATKMQGVLLTSMPEEDKADIKRRMKALRLLVVSKPDHSRLCYVVFGAGMQASTKTEVVRDRIAHQEIIEGVYFEDWLEVLDELEEMKEGYDMDYIAQCEALAEEEAEAHGDGSSSSPTASTADDADDADDLPF